jgi:hypothetical protein
MGSHILETFGVDWEISLAMLSATVSPYEAFQALNVLRRVEGIETFSVCDGRGRIAELKGVRHTLHL